MSNQTFIRQNYRIYPTEAGIQFLNQDAGNQRFVWNYFLDLSIKKYESEKKFVFYYDMAKMLPDLKDEFEFLKLGNSAALQQTLRQLDTAFKGSFKSTKNKVRKGFPKFKKKSGTGAVCYPQSVKIINNKLEFPKFKGAIKIVDNGIGLPKDFNSVTITKTASGKFHASFVVPYTLPDKIQINSNSSAVGIDLNSKHIAVLDDGSAVINPKHLLKKEKKLKKYQRQFSRKQKRSKNKEKSRIKLAKLHEKVANCRKDFVEKLSLDIVRNNDVIVIEDLNVKRMQKWNGRMIQSAPFGAIRNKLTWKANRLGKHLVVIGRYIPTSKVCSDCGQIHEFGLETRWISCDCGNEIHRDHNAAKNILNAGLKILEENLEKNITGGTPELACGETKVHDSRNGIRWVSLCSKEPKQESSRLLV